MANKIVGYPIFEVGRWNEMSFTDEDLLDIASNFAKLRDVQRVPIKLGHNDEQAITDGKPALGWVENVRKVGRQILADFVDIPSILMKAIEQKLFRTVSIELLLNVKRKGETFKHVLDAVAILGADQPAVYTLPDLQAYLASRSSVFDGAGQRLAFEAIAGNQGSRNPADPGQVRRDSVMDEKEVQKRIDAAVDAAKKVLMAQIEELQAKVNEQRQKLSVLEDEKLKLETANKRFTAEAEERGKAETKAKVKLARDGATKLLDDAVKDKQITPAQRETAVKLFGINDDVRILTIDLDEVREFFSIQKDSKGKGNENARFKQEDTSESGGHDDLPEGRTHKDTFAEVKHRISVKRGENAKLTYSEAMRAVFHADPELHREYLTATPPKTQEVAA